MPAFKALFAAHVQPMLPGIIFVTLIGVNAALGAVAVAPMLDARDAQVAALMQAGASDPEARAHIRRALADGAISRGEYRTIAERNARRARQRAAAHRAQRDMAARRERCSAPPLRDPGGLRDTRDPCAW